MPAASEIHVFHFRCPFCGASPQPVLLRDFLGEWARSPQTRVRGLLSHLTGALRAQIDSPPRHSTKKFRFAAEKIVQRVQSMTQLPGITPIDLLASGDGGRSFRSVDECAFCRSSAGPRVPDNYFTTWNLACRVQLGNILYETGLVFWGVLAHLPEWASGRTLAELNELRLLLRKAGRAGSFLECPQCGRLGTHLYGGLSATENGFCRWCLDMGGGLPLGFWVETDEEGNWSLTMRPRDYSAPARNCWDILPPETPRIR